MEYRECQNWVEAVVEAYECLLDEILELKSVEEIRRKIREFRGESKKEELSCSGTKSKDRMFLNKKSEKFKKQEGQK